MEEKEFRTENTLSFKFYKEFSKGLGGARSRDLKIILVLVLAVYIFSIFVRSYDIVAKAITILLFLFFITQIVIRMINKIRYNQITFTNKNLPIKNILSINKDGIKIVNPDSNNEIEYTFDSINSIVETENMFILMMKNMKGVSVDKNNLTGGTKEEFIQYMLNKCTNIKKKKVNNYRKNIKFLYWYIIVLIFILIISIIMPFIHNKKIKTYLESNGYEITDVTDKYTNSNVEYAIKIDKDKKFISTYIYNFKSKDKAWKHFLFWIDDDLAKESIKQGKVYNDGYKMLLINGKYVLYADEYGLDDEITNLFESLNDYLY